MGDRVNHTLYMAFVMAHSVQLLSLGPSSGCFETENLTSSHWPWDKVIPARKVVRRMTGAGTTYRRSALAFASPKDHLLCHS